MILADTSVWIDDVRRPIRRLRDEVAVGNILSHEMVIGELMLGNLPDRPGFLDHLRSLPAIPVLPSEHLLTLIEAHSWMGKGIGYVDAHLLGSALGSEDTSLWTLDRRLREVAEEHGIAHIEPGGT